MPRALQSARDSLCLGLIPFYRFPSLLSHPFDPFGSSMDAVFIMVDRLRTHRTNCAHDLLSSKQVSCFGSLGTTYHLCVHVIRFHINMLFYISFYHGNLQVF